MRRPINLSRFLFQHPLCPYVANTHFSKFYRIVWQSASFAPHPQTPRSTSGGICSLYNIQARQALGINRREKKTYISPNSKQPSWCRHWLESSSLYLALSAVKVLASLCYIHRDRQAQYSAVKCSCNRTQCGLVAAATFIITCPIFLAAGNFIKTNSVSAAS